MSAAKKILKILLIILGIIIALAVCLLAFLTITDYRPDDVLDLELEGISAGRRLMKGGSISVTTFNTGYAALSETEDFFMDGGTKTRPDDEELVRSNMRGILGIMDDLDSDVYFLQEVDINSYRSYGTNQFEYYSENSNGLVGAHAKNYKCLFVPYPLPPLGKVDSGVATFSYLDLETPQRVALPSPFSWPMSTANLKRCALVSRVPVEDSDSELVLINVHLDAYDDGSGRIAQTYAVLDYAYAEYDKGNYVIVGGDFNQQFPDVPLTLNEPGLWEPGSLSTFELEEGWSFRDGGDIPTCRLLNEPYTEAENPQYYAIDGFIVSPNLTVESVEVQDYEFKYSDHNPVIMNVTLN